MKFLKLLIILIACSDVENKKISVSIYPIKLLLNDIGVDSDVIIDKPVDIHSFEPSARKVLQVQNSCAFIYINDNFEVWAKKIKSKHKINLLEDEQKNPHSWTDPKFILESIKKIENALSLCNINYQKEKVEKLYRSLKEIDSINEVRSRNIKSGFILLHTSLEPFLKSYNLKIEAILIKEGQRDILPSDLEAAFNSKHKILVAESYYDEQMIKFFIKNNFKIISIDPLGINFKNYTEFIKSISDSILLNKYVSRENL
ncbi:MAG: metal ABC transporter substrate-binding protein [candidate division WOR-3 bacterium]